MLNRYQKLLPRSLHYCALAVQPTNGAGTQYHRRIGREQVRILAAEDPNARIIGGNINGHLLSSISEINLQNLTLQQFNEKIDKLLQLDECVPNLFVIAGDYPYGDATRFDIQCRSNKVIYVYGISPSTDMPVYSIQDKTLERIKSGEIHSPKTHTIYPDIDAKIKTALHNEPILFL